MNVQWYPGHMAKARRQMKEKLSRADFVIEVLDARAPRSTLNPDLEEIFAGKHVFYVLNKADLADPAITRQWIDELNRDGRSCCSYSVVENSGEYLEKKLTSDAQSILQKYEDKGMHKTLRGMVAGVPNVGKSAVLNRLIGTSRMTEGNKPGVTRSLQWARINPHLEILDSPGMLWPKFEDEKTGAVLALIGCVPPDVLNEEELAYYLLDDLRNTEPALLTKRYGIEVDKDRPTYDLLEDICRRRGFLRKGGELDIDRGASTLLGEFRNGKLGALSLEAPSRR